MGIDSKVEGRKEEGGRRRGTTRRSPETGTGRERGIIEETIEKISDGTIEGTIGETTEGMTEGTSETIDRGPTDTKTVAGEWTDEAEKGGILPKRIPTTAIEEKFKK